MSVTEKETMLKINLIKKDIKPSHDKLIQRHCLCPIHHQINR